LLFIITTNDFKTCLCHFYHTVVSEGFNVLYEMHFSNLFIDDIQSFISMLDFVMQQTPWKFRSVILISE
jgi:hypothetical protein